MAKTRSKQRKSKSPVAAAATNLAPLDRKAIARQAVVLFGVALAVRLLHFFCMRNSLLFEVLICDPAQYDKWAQEIASGQWLGSEVFYQTPLYPYFLGVTYSLFGHSIWAVRFLQAIFGAVSCVFLARAGARYFSERVGWIAGLLLAFYPPAIFFDGILQKASLDLLLMTALLWILAELQSQPRTGLFVAAGAVLAAATLNRENAAALFPVVLVWIAWFSWPGWKREGALRAAAFLAGGAALLLPVGLRNYYVGGTFAVTTAQMGPNFYIGNHAGAHGGAEPMRPDRGDPRYERLDAQLLAEDALKRPLSPGEVSSYWLGRSLDYIRENPLDWLRLLGHKWFMTWNSLEMIDAESIYTHEHESPLLGTLAWFMHFGVLCPLAALGLWFTRRDWRRLWLLYAIMLAFAAAVTAFFVFARYRFPLVPVAALFAGAGLSILWDQWRNPALRDRFELGVGLAIATAVAVFCNIPMRLENNDDAVTYYNAGTTLLDMGNTESAITLLKKSAELDPKFAPTQHNLARATTDRGDLPQARRYFEEAIRLDPTHGIYYFNLGGLAFKQGDEAQAIACLRKAIELDPLLVQAFHLLGAYELQKGDKVAGVAHLRRAVELEPNSAETRVELAVALLSVGQSQAAAKELQTAIELDPRQISRVNNLAWIQATSPDSALRNGKSAILLAQTVERLTEGKVPEVFDTLAAAFAEDRQFNRAVEAIDRALALATSGERAELSKKLAERRKLYAAGQPLRDDSLTQPAAPK